MAASFPARRSAPQRRRGQQGVERLGCWDWLASPGQLVEIVKAIQRQGQLQKRIQRDQSFALKSLQRTPGHARARRQFSLRQVHGKTPCLEPPCNSSLYLLHRLEIHSQYITSSSILYNAMVNILTIISKQQLYLRQALSHIGLYAKTDDRRARSWPDQKYSVLRGTRVFGSSSSMTCSHGTSGAILSQFGQRLYLRLLIRRT